MRWFLVLALSLCATFADAANSLHLSCPGFFTQFPDSVYFPQAACSTFQMNGTTTVGLHCGAGPNVVGVSNGGTFGACTSGYDDVSTTGLGHLYVNCIDCPYLDVDGVTRTNIGRMQFLQSGVAASGCVLQSLPVANTYKCSVSHLVGCALSGALKQCSLTYRREPDVANLENYVVMGFAIICLVIGFVFGWKAVQRGASQ